MNELPSDLNKLVLLKWSANEIEKYCKRTPGILKYCNDVTFWMDWFDERGVYLTEQLLPKTYKLMILQAKKLESNIED